MNRKSRIRYIFPRRQSKTAVNSTEEQKKKADYEKVMLDSMLVKKNIENFTTQQALEKRKVWLTFITSILGIVGLFITFYNQYQQSTLLQRQRIDDDYSKNIELLSKATTVQSKLSAIAIISNYLNPEFSNKYKSKILPLLISYAEADSSVLIQENIRYELTKDAARETLALLIDQNVSLVKSIDKYFIIAYHKLEEFNSDTKPQILELIWNMHTIVECLNKIKYINSVDLSNTVIGKLFGKDSLLFNLNDVTFQNVSFNHAHLQGLFFKNSQFKNVSFDTTRIFGAQFTNCNFDSQCSFKLLQMFNDNFGIETRVRPGFHIWRSCIIEGTEFSLLDPQWIPLKKPSPNLFFTRCKWNFQSVGSDTLFNIPRTGSNEKDSLFQSYY